MRANNCDRSLSGLTAPAFEATQIYRQFVGSMYNSLNAANMEAAKSIFQNGYGQAVLQPMNWSGYETLPVGAEYSFQHKATGHSYGVAPVNVLCDSVALELEGAYINAQYQWEGARYAGQCQELMGEILPEPPFQDESIAPRRQVLHPFANKANNAPPYILVRPCPITNLCNATTQQISFQVLIQYTSTYEIYHDGSMNMAQFAYPNGNPANDSAVPTLSMIEGPMRNFKMEGRVNHGRTYYNVPKSNGTNDYPDSGTWN